MIIIEKSGVLGYVASSLNLVLEGYISRLEDSRTTTASELLSEGINVMLNSEVINIFPQEKLVQFVTSTESYRQEDEVSYDGLILAMGSSTFRSEFASDVEAHITTYKTIGQSKQALEKSKRRKPWRSSALV